MSSPERTTVRQRSLPIMAVQALATFAVALLLAGCTSIFSLGPAREPAELIRQSEAALGSSDMNTLVFRGRGLSAAVGQAQSPEEDWPVRQLRSFSRAMNFDERAYREDFIRGPATAVAEFETNTSTPALQPGEKREDKRGVVLARQAFSWDVVGVAVAPSQTSWQSRMHDLWLSTPQGAVKGAARHGARAGRRYEGLRRLNTLSFEVPGQFEATLLLDDDGLVRRIESVLPEPLLGDVAVRTEFSDYRPRGGLNFPHRIVQHHDDVLVLDVQVNSVFLNEPLLITVPENVRTSGNAPAVEFLSDGLWLLAGGTHHSVLIEQADQLVLVEAPLDDERGRALVGSARRLVDKKPLGTVVATHHHLDQIGGLRVVAGTGATVFISSQAQPWLQAALQRPLARRPDPLLERTLPLQVEAVGALRMLDDPHRPVEVHAVRNSPHANGMLMVWLPRERLLIHAEADAGDATAAASVAGGAAGGATGIASAMQNLLDNVARLGLTPLKFVSLQGGRQTAAEVYRSAGRTQPP